MIFLVVLEGILEHVEETGYAPMLMRDVAFLHSRLRPPQRGRFTPLLSLRSYFLASLPHFYSDLFCFWRLELGTIMFSYSLDMEQFHIFTVVCCSFSIYKYVSPLLQNHPTHAFLSSFFTHLFFFSYFQIFRYFGFIL